MVIFEIDKFCGIIIGYLKIVLLFFIVKIVGGNLISWGFGKKVKIDVLLLKDLDVENV